MGKSMQVLDQEYLGMFLDSRIHFESWLGIVSMFLI